MSKEYRPKLQLPITAIEKRLDGISVILLMGCVLLSIWAFMNLPDQVPIHWNVSGEVDSYGSKYWLFFLPFIASSFHYGLIKLCNYPHTFNYIVKLTPDNVQNQYIKGRKLLRLVNLGSQIILAIIVVATIRGATGGSDSLGPWFVPAVLILSIVPLFYTLWDKYYNS